MQQRIGIKLLHHNFKHHGFTYSKGLNVDPVKWNPSGSCQPGGLYYTVPQYANIWTDRETTYVADVTVPDEYEVYADDVPATKWKAPALVLSNIRTLHDFMMTVHDGQLYDFVYHSQISRLYFSQYKDLYRRCLGLGFNYVFDARRTDFGDILVAVKHMPEVVQSADRLLDSDLIKLVEANPECLIHYPRLGLVGDTVFKRAVALRPELKSFALCQRPSLCLD